MRLVSLIFTCMFIASFFLVPALAQEEGEYLHIKEMSLRFDGDDATATIYFDLDLFGDIYIFAFGSRHLEPELAKVFSDFDDFQVRELGRDNAVIFLNNVSRKSDEFYLFTEKELGLGVEDLVIIYPSGPSKSLSNVRVIPNLFYEVP